MEQEYAVEGNKVVTTMNWLGNHQVKNMAGYWLHYYNEASTAIKLVIGKMNFDV